MIHRVAVVGAGALGLLYGDLIAKVLGPENVTYVMDPARLLRHQSDVYTVNGEVRHLNMAEEARAELVILAVKHPSFDEALPVLDRCVAPGTILLSVMNGIISEPVLADRYPDAYVVPCIAQGMDAMRFGTALTCTQAGLLLIGVTTPALKPALRDLTALLIKTEIPYRLEPDFLRRMWGKFMLNVGVNQTCMVYDVPYGDVVKPGEARDAMIAAMREVMALAAAKGITLTEQDLQDYLGILDRIDPEAMPSMRQDALQRHPSEVEIFAGTVLELGQSLGVDTPVNRFLYDRIHEIEAAYGDPA